MLLTEKCEQCWVHPAVIIMLKIKMLEKVSHVDTTSEDSNMFLRGDSPKPNGKFHLGSLHATFVVALRIVWLFQPPRVKSTYHIMLVKCLSWLQQSNSVLCEVKISATAAYGLELCLVTCIAWSRALPGHVHCLGRYICNQNMDEVSNVNITF